MYDDIIPHNADILSQVKRKMPGKIAKPRGVPISAGASTYFCCSQEQQQ